MIVKIKLFFAYILLGIMWVVLKALELAWACVRVVFVTAFEIVKYLALRALNFILSLAVLGYLGNVLLRWLVEGRFSLAL